MIINQSNSIVSILKCFYLIKKLFISLYTKNKKDEYHNQAENSSLISRSGKQGNRAATIELLSRARII